MSYLNITKDLTAQGKKLPIGKVLIFDYEGSPVYLQIKKKDKGQVFAKRLDPKKFLTPEEADDQVTITQN